MSLNRWWGSDAVDKAEQFLRTGKFNDVVMNAPLNYDLEEDEDGNNLKRSGCTSSIQCPAGFACVGGVCRKTGPMPPTSGSWSSAGDCDQDNPNSPCNKGGRDSCQSAANCGDIPDPREEDCCEKERCCRFSALATGGVGVRCSCGPCPDLELCSAFCSSYADANGEEGPGCGGKSCDECTYCDGQECRPKTDASCHCDAGKGCGEYGKCDATSGQCVESPEDYQECTTISNFQCPCNKILSPFTVCKPAGAGGPVSGNLAQEEGVRQCEALCGEDGEEGACGCNTNCEHASYCTDTGTGSAACPSGWTQTGSMSAGGEGCAFCKRCSGGGGGCLETECSCHSDCGPCQQCSGGGQCVGDPVC